MSNHGPILFCITFYIVIFIIAITQNGGDYKITLVILIPVVFIPLLGCIIHEIRYYCCKANSNTEELQDDKELVPVV